MSETNSQNFGTRVAEARKKMGLTQKKLSEILAVSLSGVQNYESGRIPNGEILIRLSRALNCSADWLLTGEETGGAIFIKKGALPNEAMMIAHARDKAGYEEAKLNGLPSIYNGRETLVCDDCEITMVPMVEARLSAGGGSWETSTNSDRRYAFRTDFLRRKGNASTMVLMRVAGDSMEPEIKDNDVVLVDTSNTTPRPGRLFAIAVEDLVYLKKVDAEPGRLILTSANPAYAPLEIDARGDLRNGIRIIGKAVWVGRELD